MSNIHSNDIHVGLHASSPFGSADAEINIDRTPIGVGPDSRCAMLVSTLSMGALTVAVRTVTLVRGVGRLSRELRDALNDDEKLRALVLATARHTQRIVDAELAAIVAEVAGEKAAPGRREQT